MPEKNQQDHPEHDLGVKTRIGGRRPGEGTGLVSSFGPLHGNLWDSTKHYDMGIIQTKVTQLFNKKKSLRNPKCCYFG